jgi:hypothetical protein
MRFSTGGGSVFSHTAITHQHFSARESVGIAVIARHRNVIAVIGKTEALRYKHSAFSPWTSL